MKVVGTVGIAVDATGTATVDAAMVRRASRRLTLQRRWSPVPMRDSLHVKAMKLAKVLPAQTADAAGAVAVAAVVDAAVMRKVCR